MRCRKMKLYLNLSACCLVLSALCCYVVGGLLFTYSSAMSQTTIVNAQWLGWMGANQLAPFLPAAGANHCQATPACIHVLMVCPAFCTKHHASVWYFFILIRVCSPPEQLPQKLRALHEVAEKHGDSQMCDFVGESHAPSRHRSTAV